ncbi:flagellin [Tropicibacter sp. S64]|uniref:flagellin N-terminal helical domain-containing protein n=1 Tax=Tropicibacter sp. S64 TaxID=3415122 RepID=UPI003C7E762A
MTSIVTNNASQVALRTLQAAATDLDRVQATLGTGKRIATAQDNPALWAVSKTMESEVKGYVAVQSSLDMGRATLSVARSGAEAVVGTLGDMKKTIIAARNAAADSGKLQARFAAQVEQIRTIVGAAQFNGINLLQDTGTAGETGDFRVTAYAGGLTSGAIKIAVARQDLRLDAGAITAGATALSAAANSFSGALETGQAISAGSAYAVDFDGAVPAGAGYSLAITGGTGVYAALNTTSESQLAFVAGNDSTGGDIRTVLASAFNAHVKAQGFSTDDLVAFAGTGSAGQMIVEAKTSAASGSFTVQVLQYARTDSSGGGLGFMDGLDLTDGVDRDRALDRIDLAVEVAARAAAHFGSAERRVEIQSAFSDKMAKTLQSRVGALVDADMTELSARQQALQVQQSLAVQALSIANSTPQTILSLLR